jgi:hypothetical protein
MSEQITAIHHRIRDVELFEVFSDELDRIESAPEPGKLTIAVGSLGIAASFLSTLIVSGHSVSQKQPTAFIVYVALTAVSAFAGLIFLFQWRSERRGLKEIFAKIRSREAAPYGSDGDELSPTALAEMPGVSNPAETGGNR